MKPTGTQPADPPVAHAGLHMVEAWFASRGWTPWAFQREVWQAHLGGSSGLIQVATGAGKTYAAYLGALAQAIVEPPRGLTIIYVTPLRAVSRDIEAALRAPIEELGLPLTVESRTGDTPSSVRTRQRDRLPHVLITTPESLTLLLARENAPELLSHVRAVLVDEWHELIASKRGSQTELALARLRGISPRLQTWALSATLPNLAQAARAVVGTGVTPRIIRGDMPRPVIVDAVLPRDARRLPWAGHLGLSMVPEVIEVLDPAVPTIVFTNTRSQAERWYHCLAILRPHWEPVIALHHGSLDRAERERVEAGLKDGSIRIVVATSSLDLGVDFEPIERVIQIGSPKGIARLVQRAGRSSHRPRAACRVTCVPTHALELLEIQAVKNALARGEVEPREPSPKPLDVLVQHLVTCALGGGFRRDELLAEVRTASSYEGLTEQEFDWALALVRHGGQSLRAYPDYHRIADSDGVFRVPVRRIAQLHRMNIGTITGDGTIEIRMMNGRSLGRIEENFVAGLREGQRFVFAGRVLTLVMFKDLVAYARPATGTTNYTPIWSGTRLPISESLSAAIRTALWDTSGGGGDPRLHEALQPLLRVQARESAIPRPDEILIEISKSREGHHLFVFPFEGRLVNAGLGSLLAWRLARNAPATFSVAANDYGFEVLSAETFAFADHLGPALFSAESLASDTLESANTNYLARLQFREIARIAGLVIQSMPGKPRSARQLQANSGLVFDVLTEFEPDNLLLHQARSEVLSRHFEQGRLARTLARLESGPLRIMHTPRPTPLAFPLLIERLAGRLSSKSVLERVEAMQRQWDPAWTSSPQHEEPPSVSSRRPRAGSRGRAKSSG